jgi:hypothetical protein
MGTYLNSTLFHKSLRIFQASMPIDTGNLRYNATTGYYYNNGFNLETGGDKAPYFDILQTFPNMKNKYGTSKKKNVHFNSFERVHFTPVYRFIQNELKGQFGGNRFLQQVNPSYGTALKTFLESRTEGLEAREAVAAKYGG